MRRLIDEDGVAGVTSNPTILYKAISESPYYRSDLGALKRDAQLSAEERYERLAIPDIQAACDMLRPVFDSSGGDGLRAWKSPRCWRTAMAPLRRRAIARQRSGQSARQGS
jgi:hypothetical protein